MWSFWIRSITFFCSLTSSRDLVKLKLVAVPVFLAFTTESSGPYRVCVSVGVWWVLENPWWTAPPIWLMPVWIYIFLCLLCRVLLRTLLDAFFHTLLFVGRWRLLEDRGLEQWAHHIFCCTLSIFRRVAWFWCTCLGGFRCRALCVRFIKLYNWVAEIKGCHDCYLNGIKQNCPMESCQQLRWRCRCASIWRYQTSRLTE